MKAALLLLLAACTEMENTGGPWEPASEITGELTPDLGPAPAPAPSPSTLRVATWNVHFGKDTETLAANIAASPVLSTADVILVQEIEAYPEEGITRAAKLAEQLGMTWFYAPARVEWNGTHGIAILSRFPLEQPLIKKLPYIDQAWNSRERNAESVEVVVGDSRVHIVNVHLDLRIGVVDRIRQLSPAVADLDGPALLGGDFNSNPYVWVDSAVPLASTEAIVGADQAAILDDYFSQQAFTGAVPTSMGTMRIPVVDIRIDNLYARDYQILGSGVDHIDGSDHWAVWFDVKL
jgi:endonuclease/exonuclease/phosphatase family metal-dependent hydrolase